jgi:cytochrome c-type biogenesis protein
LLDVLHVDWNVSVLRRTSLQGLPAAFILGLLFGIALGPCTFAYMAPVLGVVFQTSQTNYPLSMVLLLAFGIGHCSVIVAAGTVTQTLQKYLHWSDQSPALLRVKNICGVLVILGGVYLLYIS